MKAQDLPKFSDMPAVKGMPHGTAWGLWDKNGERDSCGSLNLLTPENTIAAQKEIKSGTGVALNWDLECVHEPGFAREKPKHELKDLRSMGFVAFDDLIHINTQSGSQWDGFRHWAHQETKLFYNNLTADEIVDEKNNEKNGIHQWSRRGGIVGRAVFIDYVAYAERHNIKYSPVERHEITVKEIEECAKEQGVEFKPADILVVRSGYNSASTEERVEKGKNGHEFAGVGGNEESVEWLWGLHDHFLAQWGTPIGELWNLEELSEVCAREKKYSFFLTSAPLNVHGGVASPPNALAIL
ncbi:hypothetical protein M7I_8065 [Glarea lozoyensis 74030]|uniref:Cyclase n=1 Tax=Glarea lozoyensis (strain ATCC 74030 / MF5533) TaxID=1104152 RepID=H0EZ03_GLAL7|nr:hypothetical protein M7I_8065 [Glarea lozoyensis 74030]